MEFGDVILSENRVTESHGTPQNPGAGGWPTIRYYNKETGYGGAPYPKKHEGMAMCDELGDEGRMEDYVVEVSGASLCNIKTHDGCTDKEKEFVEQDEVRRFSKYFRIFDEESRFERLKKILFDEV